MQLNQSDIDSVVQRLRERVKHRLLDQPPEWLLWYLKWIDLVWKKYAAKAPEYNAQLNPNSETYRAGLHWYVSRSQTIKIARPVAVSAVPEVHEVKYLNKPCFVPIALHIKAYVKRIGDRNDAPEQRVEVSFSHENYEYALKDGLIFCASTLALDSLIDLLDYVHHKFHIDRFPSDPTRMSVEQLKIRTYDWHEARWQQLHAHMAKAETASVPSNPKRVHLGKITVQYPRHEAELDVYELKNADALIEEGTRMRNCVASYEELRLAHRIRLFSLQGPSRDKSYTLETDTLARVNRQLRGFANRTPTVQERLAVETALVALGFQWKTLDRGFGSVTFGCF